MYYQSYLPLQTRYRGLSGEGDVVSAHGGQLQPAASARTVVQLLSQPVLDKVLVLRNTDRQPEGFDEGRVTRPITRSAASRRADNNSFCTDPPGALRGPLRGAFR
jgi:hypothetical protein